MAQQSSSGRLIRIAQVTVAESRENDTIGNAKTIFETYVAPSTSHFSDTDAFVVYADNNNAANFYFSQNAVYRSDDCSNQQRWKCFTHGKQCLLGP